MNRVLHSTKSSTKLLGQVPPNVRRKLQRRLWEVISAEFGLGDKVGRIVLEWGPPRKPFRDRCGDCGMNVPPMVILKDAVWLSIAKKEEHLCPDCMEKRLGRRIVWGDLKPCGITGMMVTGVRIAAQTIYSQNTEGILEAFRERRDPKRDQHRSGRGNRKAAARGEKRGCGDA
jgi:hypothetical protein